MFLSHVNESPFSASEDGGNAARMPCSSESADGNTNNPVAEIFAELRERLQCGGPEVRLELVQALIDGSLSPEDHTTVQGNVDRYREWNDAYWELRTTAKEGDEEI